MWIPWDRASDFYRSCQSGIFFIMLLRSMWIRAIVEISHYWIMWAHSVQPIVKFLQRVYSTCSSNHTVGGHKHFLICSKIGKHLLYDSVHLNSAIKYILKQLQHNWNVPVCQLCTWKILYIWKAYASVSLCYWVSHITIWEIVYTFPCAPSETRYFAYE